MVAREFGATSSFRRQKSQSEVSLKNIIQRYEFLFVDKSLKARSSPTLQKIIAKYDCLFKDQYAHISRPRQSNISVEHVSDVEFRVVPKYEKIVTE